MACTVMSNLGLHEALRSAGVSVLTTAVGDRHVIEALRAGGYSFGGENSGHLIFADHATTGDGILSALQLLRIMKRRGRPLSELAQVMREYPQRLVNLKVRAKPPLESLPELQAALREADAAFGQLGRHLIRYSGTENKVRILVEHREEEVVEAWSSRLRDVLEHAIA
jgi:phosphoglucosamine mutase